MKHLAYTSLCLLALPVLARAQDVDAVIYRFGNWVNAATGILAALALLVFFWGVVKYIAAAGDEKAKDQGKRVMVGGVVALFVLFSVFGLVRFLQRSFGVTPERDMQPPEVDFGRTNQGDDDDDDN